MVMVVPSYFAREGIMLVETLLTPSNMPSAPSFVGSSLVGEMVEDDDKVAASQRTCLWMADATAVLHDFKFQVAEKTIREHNLVTAFNQPELLNMIEMIRKVANGQLNKRVLDGIREKLYYMTGVPDLS
jgi:hypothetical protein